MPLKKSEIEQFKKRLLALRAQITQNIKGTTQAVTEPDTSKGYSQHQADEGTDDFDRTISLELTTNDYNILRQIERALEKVEEGTYGVCDLTGAEIPLLRLEAVPYATMTVDAQNKLEKGLI